VPLYQSDMSNNRISQDLPAEAIKLHDVIELLLKSEEQSDFYEEQLQHLKRQSDIHREQLGYVKQLLECVQAMGRQDSRYHSRPSTAQDYRNWNSMSLQDWQRSRIANSEKSASLRRDFLRWFRDSKSGPPKWSHMSVQGSVPIITIDVRGTDRKEVKIPWEVPSQNEGALDFYADRLESVWPVYLGQDSPQNFEWNLGDEAKDLHATHFSYSYNEYGSPKLRTFEKVCFEYAKGKP
jgi:hypothetical protein